MYVHYILLTLFSFFTNTKLFFRNCWPSILSSLFLLFFSASRCTCCFCSVWRWSLWLWLCLYRFTYLFLSKWRYSLSLYQLPFCLCFGLIDLFFFFKSDLYLHLLYFIWVLGFPFCNFICWTQCQVPNVENVMFLLPRVNFVCRHPHSYRRAGMLSLFMKRWIACQSGFCHLIRGINNNNKLILYVQLVYERHSVLSLQPYTLAKDE